MKKKKKTLIQTKDRNFRKSFKTESRLVPSNFSRKETEVMAVCLPD